jgi:molybdenum cofactor guanylyltransferase
VAEPVSWSGLPAILDEPAGQGPLAGIYSGLRRAPQWVLAVAVDMPHLRGEVLDLLLAVASPTIDAVAFRLHGLPEPLVALWGPACAEVVQRRLARGERKVAAALLDPELRVAWVDEALVRTVDPMLRAFVNVNEAADVAAL